MVFGVTRDILKGYYLPLIKGLFNHNKSCPEENVCVEGNLHTFSISTAYFLSLFYIFRMLTEKIIKHFRVITVSGIHMCFLCMTKFALYTLLSLNQSEWIREQDVDLTRLKPP